MCTSLNWKFSIQFLGDSNLNKQKINNICNKAAITGTETQIRQVTSF